MADNVQKGDFIELDYTGRTKDEGAVFDTTLQAVADEAHLHVHKDFRPVIVCAGEGHLLPGLDKEVVGRALGKHVIDVPAEDGFGKRSAKLLQLIPRRIFKEQGVQPMPGLEINVDNQVGVIKTVSGGRIIVDFNHPLAGHDLAYEVDIKRKVTSQEEQVEAMLRVMRIPFDEVKVTGEGQAEVVGEASVPQEFIDVFAKDVVRLTGVKDILFTKKGAQPENNKV